MSNTINVSAVDNEIYIIAINNNTSISYQLCHILSGYNFTVDVTLNIFAGTYSEPTTINGLSGNLKNISNDIMIPAGTYYIMAVGIDWGGAQQIELTVNDQQFGSGESTTDPKPSSIFWTNEGNPLTTIDVEIT